VVQADVERPAAPKDHFSEIVCGTDFSTASFAALERALRLAQESGGRVHVLHVLEGLPGEFPVSGRRASRFLQEFRAIEARALEQLRAALPDDVSDWCEVEIRVTGGVPHREIVRMADSVGADLIVIGARPHGLVERALASATLGGVLRRASAPVLAVPASSETTAEDVRAARAEPSRATEVGSIALAR
jgi:nucleotide-binding universal stress UspA family protein